MNSNFPNNDIFEWELEYGMQEIELNNGMELLFTLPGDFIKIGESGSSDDD